MLSDSFTSLCACGYIMNWSPNWIESTDTNRKDHLSHENGNYDEQIVFPRHLSHQISNMYHHKQIYRWTSFLKEYVLTLSGNPPNTSTTHQNQRLRLLPADVLNSELRWKNPKKHVKTCLYFAHQCIYDNHFYVVQYNWPCLNYNLVSLSHLEVMGRQQFAYNSTTSHQTLCMKNIHHNLYPQYDEI